MGPLQLNGDLWITFVLYWIFAAFSQRRPEKRDSHTQRSIQLISTLIGLILVFSRVRLPAPLQQHFLPANWYMHGAWAPVYVLGNSMTALGIAFALGQYWSARASIVSGHKLIRTGPYSHIRHPIYTGIILALFGSALVLGRWRDLVGVCIIVIGLVQKAKVEESLLAGQFREEFEEYKRVTGFLLPKSP